MLNRTIKKDLGLIRQVSAEEYLELINSGKARELKRAEFVMPGMERPLDFGGFEIEYNTLTEALLADIKRDGIALTKKPNYGKGA